LNPSRDNRIQPLLLCRCQRCEGMTLAPMPVQGWGLAVGLARSVIRPGMVAAVLAKKCPAASGRVLGAAGRGDARLADRARGGG